MAKRRNNGNSELNLDSLMDTVTNVVGVLMIVFIMVALNIAQTVNKILSDLPPVTQQQVDELRKKLDALPPPVKKPEDVKKQIDVNKDLVAKLNEQINSVDLTEMQNKVKFMDLEEIQKKIDAATKERDAAKKDLDKLFAEIDRLKKALDDTPVYQPPPPKYVRIPNPRPLPENVVKENFLITKGRVVYLNEAQFLSAVMAEFDKNKKAFLSPQSAPDKPLYTPAKVLEHFSRARIGDRTLSATVEQTAPTSNALFMKLVLQEGGGEDITQVKNPASFYQRALRKLKTEPGKVVSFSIAPDSAEAYLEARIVADAIGVPVLWNLSSIDYHRVRMPGIVLDVPPPPKPTTPPPPPGQGIKPPTEQID